MKKDTHVFRANVAALITKNKKILAFQRIHFPEQWQCPQGGIDKGDTPESAIWREVKEETGLDHAQLELVSVHPNWLSYEYPDKSGDFYGQTQKWFLFEFTGDEADIKPDNYEFMSWTWMAPEELVATVDDAKRELFTQVQKWFESK